MVLFPLLLIFAAPGASKVDSSGYGWIKVIGEEM